MGKRIVTLLPSATDTLKEVRVRTSCERKARRIPPRCAIWPTDPLPDAAPPLAARAVRVGRGAVPRVRPRGGGRRARGHL